MSLGESVAGRGKVWLRKRPMNLCSFESEDHEDGVGVGVNTTEYFSSVRYTTASRSHRIFFRKDRGLVVKKTHGSVGM